MRMHTTAGQLRAALGAFQGIIDNRQTIPVLGTVKFQDGRLVGTDLDTEISVAVPSIGKMSGEACIDWHSLHSLARCIDGAETLTIEEDDGMAAASFNGSVYQMASLPVSDFPTFGPVDGAQASVGNLGLIAAMNRVRFAVSTEETRYYLNGVAILKDPDGRVVVAATNGHRLAFMPVDGAPDESVGAIIPRNIVHYLCRRKTEPQSCVFDKEHVRARFDFPGVTMSAKLIDGTFPDIFRVVPRETKEVFSTERLAFLRVLLRLRAFIKGKHMPVKLTVDGDTLTVSVKSGDYRATETIPLDAEAPMAVEAGFNGDYLIDVLDTLRGERVTFATGETFGSAPTVVTADGDPLKIVQMPMRV